MAKGKKPQKGTKPRGPAKKRRPAKTPKPSRKPKRPARGATRAGPYPAIAREIASVRAALKITGEPGEQVRIKAAIRNLDFARALLGITSEDGEPSGEVSPSYSRVRAEILRARADLEAQVPEEPGAARERLITLIRDLDITLVVLECNQSLSATDYHTVPWKHMPLTETLAASRRADGTIV